jgi:hypothetical protein
MGKGNEFVEHGIFEYLPPGNSILWFKPEILARLVGPLIADRYIRSGIIGADGCAPGKPE